MRQAATVWVMEVTMRINARLSSLQRQHEALEDEIKLRQRDRSEDSLDIWTLKRKKLALKEEIKALAHNG